RARFARQTAGSPDPSERWLNWVVRLRGTGEAVGTAQATVRSDDARATTAALAWVIGAGHQGQGFAKEAAGLVAAWLREQGVERLTANIHPRHAASNAVARSIGLAPTTIIVDGEIQWQSQRSPMEFEQITTELRDHVLTITLNRPDRLNAWTQTMFTELMTAFDSADADDEVRAVIVTGAGRGFCAGADLERGGETFTKRDHHDPDTIPRDSGGRLSLRIFDMTKPV